MPKSTKDFDSVKTWGLVICVRLSKTVQFRERQLLIPVMRLPKRHPLCPVQAYERHISAFPAPPALPAFLYPGSGHATPITHSVFTANLRKVLTQAGFLASKFSGHSFRHGGASFAFRCGAPVELISLQGDWRGHRPRNVAFRWRNLLLKICPFVNLFSFPFPFLFSLLP